MLYENINNSLLHRFLHNKKFTKMSQIFTLFQRKSFDFLSIILPDKKLIELSTQLKNIDQYKGNL